MDWQHYIRYMFWRSDRARKKYCKSENSSRDDDLWTRSRDLPAIQNNGLINKSLAPSTTLHFIWLVEEAVDLLFRLE